MTRVELPDHSLLNILLVDDDDGDAKAVRRSFQKAEIANPIIRALDGVEALDMLRGSRKGEVPPSRILLVDLNMPRMNGIQFVQALRQDPNLQREIVFILTTSHRDEDRIAAYNLNVAGFILKARAGDDFLNLVRLMRSYWQIVELPRRQRPESYA